MFVYLKGNAWVEIPDCTRVAIVDDEMHCLDDRGKVLARFSAMDVQLYSRVKLRTGSGENEDEIEQTPGP